MKIIKGIMIGSMVTAGIVMMHNDYMGKNRKKVLKRGRQFAKKVGII